jgi:hypothetical protein
VDGTLWFQSLKEILDCLNYIPTGYGTYAYWFQSLAEILAYVNEYTASIRHVVSDAPPHAPACSTFTGKVPRN